MMLVKIVCQNPQVSPNVLVSLNLEINQLESFIDQVKTYGITWETTNISFKFVECGYVYYPSDNSTLFFKITMKEVSK